MKMKVRVDKLQAAIHKHIAQDQRRFERESKKYEADSKKARERYILNVNTYLSNLRDGKDVHDSYDLDNYLRRGCKFPDEPKKPNTHASLLVKLDLAEDQVLVVDDHSDYMKFLDGKCVCR